MVDFVRARRAMVDGQLRTSGITDWRILDVMNRIPREAFVPEHRRGLSYLDEAVAVSPSRLMPAPAAFARLVQLAQITPNDVVLDIGCGAGYSTAVIAGLADAVVALEDDPELVAKANETLAGLDIGNAAVVAGPLTAGVSKEAPFDVIMIEGAVDTVPEALFAQLRDGGRLIAAIGRGNAAVARLFVKSGEDTLSRSEFNVSLPVLDVFTRVPAFQF